jgi:DNA (cytosine-5)-methyltransferase 1
MNPLTPNERTTETMTQTRTLDGTIRCDFAGAGGMVQGIKQAGFTGRVVACEFNPAAAETARRAGHEVIEGDVRDIPFGSLGPLLGYTGGPPCQTFSAAGNGEGRKALDVFIKAARLVAQEGLTPEAAVFTVAGRTHGLDERSILVLHPLHVIVNERPTFVVLEQVKQVRPIWDVYKTLLEEIGYAVDVRVWSSEEYGAPQTRQRASLVALKADPLAGRLTGLHAPATHSRYYPRDKARRDEGVPSFVTIAEALGRFGAIRSNYGTGGDASNRGERNHDEPAATVTGKVGRNKWLFAGAGATALQTSRQQPRTEDEPAHTVTGSRSAAWVPDGSRLLDDGETVVLGDVRASRGTVRDLDEPSPTITGSLDNGNYRWQPVVAVPGDTSWVETRPSPTVVGSFRPDIIAAPGYRKAGDPPRQKTPGSIQVSVEEAAMLQTFPADYPWFGSKTEQYQQIGNAVPPVVAQAVVGHLLTIIEKGL